jgi:translation initiation factor IF-2
MNVTELARRLKVPTTELREMLPKIGFEVGQKAIKINNKLAHQILNKYHRLVKDHNKKLAYARQKQEEEAAKNRVEQAVRIELPSAMSVREFAGILNLHINEVIAALMKNGIMLSLNERIDFDTASIIAEEMGFEVSSEMQEENHAEDVVDAQEKLSKVYENIEGDKQTRPPVIVVMGHVDHGKTKLLDTIRRTNIIEGEAGGITQHIGAYQVVKKERPITFIDTPGHSAFTAMRSRGAKVADIAILIVAADDSVKPQTVEAIKILKGAGLPIIVAINKIDKDEANIERVKSDLAQHNIVSEEWGGDVPMVPISALKGDGIDELLDMILLTADMNVDGLQATSEGSAVGTIIESHVDRGEGIVATVLIQNGTLRTGDLVSINGDYYGKVRVMKDHRAAMLKEAGPSHPVKLMGLKAQPRVGDFLEVADSKKDVNKKVKRVDTAKAVHSSILRKQVDNSSEGIIVLPVILKADVSGSLEAIMESLEKIESENVKVKVISKGLGQVNENDVILAGTSEAVLISFNLDTNPLMQQLANERGVEILKYKIIYELIDNVVEIMKGRLGFETIKTELGKAKVKAIFKTEKSSMILGLAVSHGEVELREDQFDTRLIVTRNGEYVTEGTIKDLRIAKEQVKQVLAGSECGIEYHGRPVVEVDDVLEIYKEEKKKKEL